MLDFGAMTQHHKISISLPEDLLEYAETYRLTHGLASRGEVLAQALKQLCEAKLVQGYRDFAAAYGAQRDPLSDALGAEGLEPSDETNG